MSRVLILIRPIFILCCFVHDFYPPNPGDATAFMVELLLRTSQNRSSAVAEMGDGLVTNHNSKTRRGCCAPLRGGDGSPSNTMSSGPRPTSIPSGILIHPVVWPQYTNHTDRQTDRQTDKQSGQRSRSNGNGSPKKSQEVGSRKLPVLCDFSFGETPYRLL